MEFSFSFSWLLCIKLEAKDRVEDLIDQLQESHGDTKKHQEIT